MTGEPMTVLEARTVSMAFGGVRALNEVNLALPHNSTVGLIGPNGSGKTTLLNVLTGIYRHTGGTIVYEGRDIGASKVHMRGRAGILRTFQHPQLAASLTVRENVAAGDRFARKSDKASDGGTSVDDALEMFGCAQFANRLPKEVPYGFLKLAEIARAVVAGPKVLLLDEPAAGLNRDERTELVAALQKYREMHTTAMCLIEHDVDIVRALCPTLVVLETGRLLMAGDTNDVLASPQVRAAYLGDSAETMETR